MIFNDDDNNEETLTSPATAAVAAETAAPDAPRSLNVSPDDTGTLDVSWEAPASNGGSAITGYKVQWKSGSEDYDGSAGSTRQAEITDPASRTHTITGLTDGVEYAVRVIAVNDVGEGPPSDEATATPRETTPPGACYGKGRRADADPDLRRGPGRGIETGGGRLLGNRRRHGPGG